MQSVAKSPASVPQSKGSKTSVRTRMNSPSGTSDSQVRCQLPHEDCFNVLHSTVNEKLRNFHEPRQTEKASDVLLRMDRQGIIPSFEMYRSLLRACIKRKALADAKQVQAHLCRHGFGSARFLGESTVITFVKCGGLEDALQIFDRLPQRTVFSWTAMISGCTRAGQAQEALRMYERMQEEGVKPNAHTFVSLLQACGIIADLVEGKRIHADVLKHRCDTDLYVRTCLVDMYGKCGSIVDAEKAFAGLSQCDVVAWTAMIAAYVQHGQAERALQLYKQMLRDGVTPNNRTFVSVLQACGMLADKETVVYGQGVKVVSLELGRQIHSDACKEGHALDIYVGNTLVHMYGKCGSIVDAQKVFDGLLQRDVVSWTAIVAAYVEQGQIEKALQLYDHMREEGITPDARVFVSTLQACGMCAEMEDDVMVGGCPSLSTCLEKGRQVHADARKKGYDTDVFVGSTLVSMYGKFASISDAQDVFCGLSNQNVVSFNAMLATFVQLNKVEEALQLYQDMREQGVTPNERTFVSVIQACGRLAEQEEGTVLDVQTAAVKSLYMGRAMHAEAWTMGFTTDVFVGNALISMYGRCGSIMDAWSLFTELSHREVVSWNAIIGACSQQSEAEKALNLYSQMQEEGVSPDNRTVVSTLQACGMLFENGDGEPSSFFLEKIRAIHANAQMKGYVSDGFVGISLIDVYAKCGSIIDAQDVFDRLSRMSVLEWTAIITAHAQHGHAERAMQLYEQMCEEGITPNDRTLVSALQACGALAGKEDIAAGQSNKLKFLLMGKLIHAHAEKMGYSTVAGIENTLLSMYGKCGSFEDVQIVFDGMSSKSVVSWNVMLACHVQQSQAENVVQLYEQMKQEKFCSDAWTFVTVLQAYGILAEREEAVIIEGQSIKSRTLEMTKTLHADCRKHGYNSDTFVSTTLISAYGKCGDVAEAQNVFEVLSCRKVVSWNVMLGAYVENGQVGKALQLYEQMQKEHVTLNEITAVYMLQVCSNVGSLTLLRQIHNVIFANELDSRLFPASSLITAYGRCSSMMDAQKVFDTLPKPDVVSWTALIAGYSREGNCAATLHTFEKMNLACTKPDAITYLAVLSACSHAGLVDAGADYFNSMVGCHGISPKLEHYVAMVDLFGRAGCFRRVADILSTMTMQPNMDIWLCLLSACRKHGMLALGEQAFRCAVHLQPRNPAAYSLITNMYADAGLWDLADNIKKLRATEGAWKQVGQCWIEHEQQVFSFVVGGCMDLSDGLYILIGNIRSKLKAEAYIIETQNF